MPPKPTLLIVPDTWCSPPLYDSLSRPLERAGYRVRTSFLPSTGGKPICKRGTEDIETLAQTIRYCADRGEDILIIAHGAGGAAAGEAAEGLLRSDRREAGKKGGVVGIVFIAGLVLETEERVSEILPSKPGWVAVDEEKKSDLADPEVLLSGLEPAVVDSSALHIKPSALSPRSIEIRHAGWKELPCWYLVCEKDRVLDVELQEAFVEGRLERRGCEVERIEAGHFPFLEERWVGFVVEFVRRAAGERF